MFTGTFTGWFVKMLDRHLQEPKRECHFKCCVMASACLTPVSARPLVPQNLPEISDSVDSHHLRGSVPSWKILLGLKATNEKFEPGGICKVVCVCV